MKLVAYLDPIARAAPEVVRAGSCRPHMRHGRETTFKKVYKSRLVHRKKGRVPLRRVPCRIPHRTVTNARYALMDYLGRGTPPARVL